MRLAAIAVLLCAWICPFVLADASPATPTWHMEVATAQRVRVTITETVNSPQIRVQEWGIVAGLPSPCDGQADIKASLTVPGHSDIQGTTAQDKSAIPQPILSMRVPVPQAAQSTTATVQAIYEITLMRRTIRRGAPATPTPPLEAKTQAMFLAATSDFDYGTARFRNWLQAGSLVRNSQESDLDFAYRALQYISRHFKYQEIWGQDPASMVCGRGWAACGGLSNLYVATLRANGIPARTLVGRIAKSSVSSLDAATYHYRTEFFASGIGWVPVEVASVAGAEDVTPYFGQDPGDLMIMHFDEAKLDSYYRALQTMQFVFGRQAGSWDGYKLTDNIQIEPLPFLTKK